MSNPNEGNHEGSIMSHVSKFDREILNSYDKLQEEVKSDTHKASNEELNSQVLRKYNTVKEENGVSKGHMSAYEESVDNLKTN